MGFLSGLVTGAAQSIDAQLKKDIERSQERAEGMAQYRITRRRAEVERQEKEKRELKETLGNLASLVDGDIDKAAQLYKAGGGNLSGAKSLYQELLKNQQSGIDIKTAITFADEIAEPGSYEDYINKFVTPITTLPVGKDEVKGAGLYGALFKPDFAGRIERQVEEAAPLPDVKAPDLDVQMATIDRSGFLAAKEAERGEKRFEMEVERFGMDMETAQSRMDMAEKNYQLSLEKFQADQENTELEQALAFARDARDQARLDLSVAKAEEEAETAVLTRELTGLRADELRLEIEKRRNAPEFATFELMLVSAEENLAKALSRPPEMQDAGEIQIYERQRAHALKGIASVAQAEDTGTTTPSFSRQSVDSIINAEIKRQLEPVGLVKDIEGQLDYMIEGNEVQYYDRMSRALNNVEARTAGIDDSQMNNAIAAQRKSLQEDMNSYKRKMLAVDGFAPIIGADLDSILKAAYDDNAYKAGDIIEYEENGVKKHLLWTGSDLF